MKNGMKVLSASLCVFLLASFFLADSFGGSKEDAKEKEAKGPSTLTGNTLKDVLSPFVGVKITHVEGGQTQGYGWGNPSFLKEVGSDHIVIGSKKDEKVNVAVPFHAIVKLDLNTSSGELYIYCVPEK